MRSLSYCLRCLNLICIYILNIEEIDLSHWVFAAATKVFELTPTHRNQSVYLISNRGRAPIDVNFYFYFLFLAQKEFPIASRLSDHKYHIIYCRDNYVRTKSEIVSQMINWSIDGEFIYNIRKQEKRVIKRHIVEIRRQSKATTTTKKGIRSSLWIWWHLPANVNVKCVDFRAPNIFIVFGLIYQNDWWRPISKLINQRHIATNEAFSSVRQIQYQQLVLKIPVGSNHKAHALMKPA